MASKLSIALLVLFGISMIEVVAGGWPFKGEFWDSWNSNFGFKDNDFFGKDLFPKDGPHDSDGQYSSQSSSVQSSSNSNSPPQVSGSVNGKPIDVNPQVPDDKMFADSNECFSKCSSYCGSTSYSSKDKGSSVSVSSASSSCSNSLCSCGGRKISG